MLISEKQLRSAVRQMLEEQTPLPDAGVIKQGNGGYEYQMFKNGKIQIVKRNGKAYNPPLVLNQPQAVAVAKEQIQLGNKGSVARDIAAGTLVFNAAAAATPPAAPGSTSPGALQTMATFLSSIASKITVDSPCAPNVIPLWIYPFMNFLVLRKTPLTLTNATYLQSLHRICDIARARGSAGLALPGDIATAQERDPLYSGNPQGIVGADISFAKDWSKGYDYASTNPYMHIAMSLTHFKFSGPRGGPYTIDDNYDFNEPGKIDPPLGNPKYMLQQAVARSQFLTTVSQTFMTNGIFGGIEDLMRYYEATLNYGGFLITGTTVAPEGYVPPKVRAKK